MAMNKHTELWIYSGIAYCNQSMYGGVAVSVRCGHTAIEQRPNAFSDMSCSSDGMGSQASALQSSVLPNQ